MGLFGPTYYTRKQWDKMLLSLPGEAPPAVEGPPEEGKKRPIPLNLFAGPPQGELPPVDCQCEGCGVLGVFRSWERIWEGPDTGYTYVCPRCGKTAIDYFGGEDEE